MLSLLCITIIPLTLVGSAFSQETTPTPAVPQGKIQIMSF